MTKPIGLRTDHLPAEQPPNSARFVLSGVLDSPDGDTMNYQNELGTNLSASLSYPLIGHINISDNYVVLFSTDEVTSEIGLFSEGSYTSIVNSTCLGFSRNHLIKGEFKLLNGCDRTIYWTDGYNVDRQFNLDSAENYQDSSGDWDCNLFKINPDYLIPVISDITVNGTGGELEAGAYGFAVELLDDSLNSIVVGLATNYIPVYADNQSSSYPSIHGNFSSSTNTVEGGVTTTSKSITLTFDNLDTRFSYARLLASVKTTGRGLAEEAYEMSDYIPINASTQLYTFNSLSNAVRTDIERFKVKNPKYTVSQDMEQIDGRLVRANVKEDIRDYSSYQRIANEITAQWKRVSELTEEVNAAHNTKNPKSYFNGTTFLGDEIYAFGIVFVFSDGGLSPVFHIPGRESNASDTSLLTVVSGPTTGSNVSEADVQHLGLHIGQTVERWKFYSTYTGVLSGNFAYYEGTTNYPSTLGCDGEPIYGNLAGTPIRHHKFPDRRNIPAQSLDSSGQVKANKFGVQFSNITYPDSDIVGHFFVKAKRADSDKTVIDMGIIGCPLADQLVNYPSPDDNYIFAYDQMDGADQGTTVKSFSSPRIFSHLTSTGEYFKFLYYLDQATTETITDSRNNIDITSGDHTFGSAPEILDTHYRQITSSALLNPNTVYNGSFDRPVLNYSFSNSRLVVELNENITDVIPSRALIIASLKREARPYENLYLLQYEPISPIVEVADSQLFYNGSAFTGLFNYFNLYSIRADRDGFLNLNSSLDVFSEFNRAIVVDSDINYELLVEGTDCNTIFDYNNNLALYSLTKVATFDGSDWNLRAGVCAEYYAHNADYLPANPGVVQLSVPFNFDYCSDCLNQYPNRIVWSPKGFSEEKSDAYRINLVNDYVVVGENKGSITTIHYDKNRMLVLTKESCLVMSPNPRVINTDVDTAYIGTGDFLSIPPAEFAKVDYGFGGCQGRLSSVNTEYGFFWCDQKAGRVFNFNGNLDELSGQEYGNYAFFRASLPANLPGDTLDLGVKLSYDPYYKRLVIHKSDFRLYGVTVQDDDYGDVEKYENLSFTISFSPKDRCFVSFHPWQPDYMFPDRNAFYSTEGSNVWKHDKFEPEFYGNKFPFTVEYVFANPGTNVLESVNYYAQTIDSSGLDKNYPTFDTVWCYSGNQSTGSQNLIAKPTYPTFWDNTQKVVVHAEDNYRISALRDISNGSAVTSIQWADRKSGYNGKQGYVDKAPVNTSTNTSQWNLIPLRNKYHIIRLSYSGSDRLILNLTETVATPSVL